MSSTQSYGVKMNFGLKSVSMPPIANDGLLLTFYCKNMHKNIYRAYNNLKN